MNIIDFYRMEQKRLHEMLDMSTRDLTRDQWHFIPAGTGNHIAFLLWHCTRTEDNILRFLLQGRPPIWNEGLWYKRLHLPESVQGTGLSTEEAHTISLTDPPLFMQYTYQVWQEFEVYLADITDGGAELSKRLVTTKQLGEISALQAIGQACISHLFLHAGEIAQLLGAQGKIGLSL